MFVEIERWWCGLCMFYDLRQRHQLAYELEICSVIGCWSSSGRTVKWWYRFSKINNLFNGFNKTTCLFGKLINELFEAGVIAYNHLGMWNNSIRLFDWSLFTLNSFAVHVIYGQMFYYYYITGILLFVH